MRWTTVGFLGAALLTALLLSACGTSATGRGATARPPSAVRCYAFAVTDLHRRVVVRHRPAACAGLPQAQVNQIVDRAVRAVVGPHRKAVERRLAAADSRYLGDLVKTLPPPPAASVIAAQPTPAGQLGLRFAALALWLATAIPGAYMLSTWLPRAGRRRVIRELRGLSAVPIGHAGLAIAGLVIWIAFTATNAAALAWVDVGLTWVIAGLGMATLLAASPESQAVTASPGAAALVGVTEASTTPFRTRAPVFAIALHGALATLTILLVLLAAVGAG
jgi:manganese efflux pump family protein